MDHNDEDESTAITYYLPLDNSGRPKLACDQILQAEVNSTLHIELMNGLEITNKINLVSNAQENFPYDLQERLLIQENINKEDFSNYIFPPSEISTSIIYDVKLERTGAIQFFFLYTQPGTDNEKSTLPFYVTVLPKVIIQGREIKLDDIQLQTVLSKSLGKVNDFENYFKEAAKLKYNFVHFTPIQQLGISESLYCLRDNTKLNNIFFDSNNLSEEAKMKLMKEQLDKGREIYGVGSLVDIVLNHASDNSEWLGNHPECGYNLENSPWLNCAYAFDCVLQEYSNAFCDCKTSRKCQPFVNNDNELNEIMGDLWNIVNKANLHEFFMLNFDVNKRILNDFYERYNRERNKYTHKINSIRVNNDRDAFEYIFNHCLDEIGYERNGVKINAEEFGCCLIKLFNWNVNNKSQFFNKAENFMYQCNERWKKTIPDWINGGMNNIRGGMHWEFIQNHNKAVRVKKPLIPPYFAVFDKNDKRKIFACNGWVGQSEDPNNPAPNFTEKGTYYYFKRTINIWSDCPKLNYGNSPSDCPYLIKHMTKYVQQMAKMFNGFRLDNAHSTPIFLAEYLAQKAREVNPNLIIMAELFTKKEKEINFVNRIGINLLIRELIWCGNARDLSAQIHRFGGGYDHMLGKIEENKFDYIKNEDGNVVLKKMKYLLPSLPHSIIFDLTHDNETYLQKMNNLALNLTNMACNSFSSTAIGSTRGFDQLFPIQPSVVNEQRRYVYDEDFNNMFHEEYHRKVPKKEEKKKEEPKEKKIRFEYRCNNANKVALALSSRGWRPDIQLKREGGDLFSTEITLSNNQKIYYKYVINDNNWVCDNTKPKEDDGKGNVNNVIIVGSSNQSGQNNNVDTFGANTSQREFHKRDLKLLRRQLNAVRNDISLYKNEFFLHQDNQFLCIFRTFVPEENYLENIPNWDGYALICRTGYDQGGTTPTRVELPGIYSEFVCGSTMGLGKIDVEGFRRRDILYGTDSDVYFTRDGKWLNNFSSNYTEKGRTIFNFHGNTPCNSAIILKFRLTDEVRNSLVNIERNLYQINNNWKTLTANLDLCDINLVLYKCEREELDNTKTERGCYGFEKFGKLCYAGISHLHKKLNEFKLTKENNTILDNIRSGDWLLDYTIKRYKDQPNLRNIYDILCSILGNYTKLYVHHKPVYITKIIDTIYNIMIMKLYELMKNKDIINFSSFSRLLLDAVPQFNGYIESSRFKHNTEMPLNKLSLSAGLPHFSVEYMRCWGRDTFISLKGLFLIPGLFQEAKAILLNYASVMRHGLIPNLLDSGVNCRYNARDATWFFLKSVVDYVEMSKDYDIFNFAVNMVFLSDDFNEHNSKKNRGDKKNMKLAEIVHEILQRHANGINFREWRAGKDIDQQMTDEGFNIKIYFNEENGFIYGGNKWNCGTWMDKMGSSEKAKNKGHPATARNGADCEIIGLLYYTLHQLDQLNKQGKYPFNEVRLSSGKTLKYSEWARKIKNNFEKYFFIEKKDNNALHDNTYKDYISDDNDYRHEAQLRPNIFVTLAVAPELFEKNHAIKFMKLAEQYLVVKDCVGIRTLDFLDKNYNGNYEVHNDTDNYHLAHGLNYHNGPEWVWPSGFYLISKIKFNDLGDEIFSDLCRRLIPFEKYIQKDKWSGLPELTNKDGSFCEGSCPTQAWSVATIIEALDELSRHKNILDEYSNYDDKRTKKIKRHIDDEDNKDKDDDEEPKPKKKKKVVKKVKKKRRDYDEADELKNESKIEEGEKKEDDKNEEEKKDEEKKEKKVKKVKKVVKKVKPKETSEENGEEQPVKKKKKIIKKKKVKKDGNNEENSVPNDSKIEEENNEPKKKVKKVIKKKKVSKKKVNNDESKGEEESMEKVNESQSKEEPVEPKEITKEIDKHNENNEEGAKIHPVRKKSKKNSEEDKKKSGHKKVKKKKKVEKKEEPQQNNEENIQLVVNNKNEEENQNEEKTQKNEDQNLVNNENEKEIEKEEVPKQNENEKGEEEVLLKQVEDEENKKEVVINQMETEEKENNDANHEEEENLVKDEHVDKEEEEVQNVDNTQEENVAEESHEEKPEQEQLGVSNEQNEVHIEKEENAENEEKEEEEHEEEEKPAKTRRHKRKVKIEDEPEEDNQEKEKQDEEEQIINDNEVEEEQEGETKKRKKKKKPKKQEEEIVKEELPDDEKVTLNNLIEIEEVKYDENKEKPKKVVEEGECLLTLDQKVQDNEGSAKKKKLRKRNKKHKNNNDEEESKPENEEINEEKEKIQGKEEIVKKLLMDNEEVKPEEQENKEVNVEGKKEEVNEKKNEEEKEVVVEEQKPEEKVQVEEGKEEGKEEKGEGEGEGEEEEEKIEKVEIEEEKEEDNEEKEEDKNEKQEDKDEKPETNEEKEKQEGDKEVKEEQEKVDGEKGEEEENGEEEEKEEEIEEENENGEENGEENVEDNVEENVEENLEKKVASELEKPRKNKIISV